MSDRNELQAQVDSFQWYHSIDFGHGVVSAGRSHLDARFDLLPDFSDMIVLDIGTWDGMYAFHAEKQGARRVIALDEYAWALKFEDRDAYWSECRSSGVYPDPTREQGFMDWSLPGMRPFNFAKQVFDSKVEPIVGDFMTMDLNTLPGPFDVTLFLGVLYHVTDPLGALQRVRQLTRRGGVAVIETLAVALRDVAEDKMLVQFVPGEGLLRDFSIRWIPTQESLVEMCKSVGFSAVEVASSEKPSLAEQGHSIRNTLDRHYGRTHAINYYRVVVKAIP